MTALTPAAEIRPITVRRAAPDDVPWIVSQLPHLACVFGTRQSLMPDEAVARAKLRAAMASPMSAALIACRGEAPVGFMVGMILPHPFNDDVRTLTSLLLWVVPEARGSSAAARLLAEFQAFGEAHADLVLFACNVDTPIRSASLARRGFRMVEHSYVLEVS